MYVLIIGYLPSDNPCAPRRVVRTSWPKDSNAESNEPSKLSNITQEQNKNAANTRLLGRTIYFHKRWRLGNIIQRQDK